MFKSLTRRQAVLAGGASLALGAVGWTQIGKAYAAGEVKGGGGLKGVLRFTGEIPAEDSVSISKDSHICGVGDVNPNPVTLGADGALKDGVVALRKVEAGKPWNAALTQPKIVQERCLFAPFVQIAPKGAELTIVNKDPLLHNIHAYEQIGRARRTLFNIAQPAADQTDVAPLKMRRGFVVEIDCDAHNWMSAWIYTADHPYLAVTGPDGLFDIGDVPPGSYELVMWHPILGEITRDVTVAAGETLELSLDMKA